LLDLHGNIPTFIRVTSGAADIYRQRWQVELFFKWIKQHRKIFLAQLVSLKRFTCFDCSIVNTLKKIPSADRPAAGSSLMANLYLLYLGDFCRSPVWRGAPRTGWQQF
jgi:hypothetical protein